MLKVVLLGGLLNSFAGCGMGIDVGEEFTFPDTNKSILFSAKDVAPATISNQHGKYVDGLIMVDASAITNDAQFRAAKRERYAVFPNSLLGNLAEGAYRRQRSAGRIGLGLPVMDTRSTKVVVVETDSAGRVQNVRSFRASHVQLSVRTNDLLTR